MATTEELTIVARVKDLATQAVKKLDQEVRKFGTRAKAAFDKVRKAAGKLGAAFRAVRGPLTLMTAAATAATSLLGKSMSDAAADAEELSSKFDALFGGASESARAWAEEFRAAVGRGRQDILSALAEMRGFTEGLGLASDEADALAKELTQLGVDLSSFYNVAQDDAMQRLRSGLIGNAEALDAFAARISETQLKEFAESNDIAYNSLTDTEKVLLRLQVLYGKVGKAVGDAERTSDSFQNRMRALGGIIADARVKFGKFINEGVLRAIDTIGGPQGFTQLVEAALGTVASFSAALTNLAAQGLRAVVEGIERVGGAGNIFDLMANRAETIGIKAEKGMTRLLNTLDRIGKSSVFRALFEPEGYDELEHQRLVDAYAESLDALNRALERPDIAGKSKVIQREILKVYEEHKARMQEQAVAAAKALAEYEDRWLEEAHGLTESNRRLDELAKERDEILARIFSGVPSPTGLPLPLIPEEPIGPMFGPEVAPTPIALGLGAAATEADTQAVAEQSQGVSLLAQSWIYAGQAAMRYQAAIKNAAEQLKQTQLQTVADGIVTAFQMAVTQTENLEDALRQLARSIAADLLGAQLRASIFPLFGLGFANGGVIPGGTGEAMPVKGYATGGPIMRSPHVALIGEGQYNEAVVPLPDGRSIPVAMKGDSGGSGSTQVSFNVTALDAASVADLFARNGKELADIVASRFQRSRNVQASLGGGLV